MNKEIWSSDVSNTLKYIHISYSVLLTNNLSTAYMHWSVNIVIIGLGVLLLVQHWANTWTNVNLLIINWTMRNKLQ